MNWPFSNKSDDPNSDTLRNLLHDSRHAFYELHNELAYLKHEFADEKLNRRLEKLTQLLNRLDAIYETSEILYSGKISKNGNKQRISLNSLIEIAVTNYRRDQDKMSFEKMQSLYFTKIYASNCNLYCNGNEVVSLLIKIFDSLGSRFKGKRLDLMLSTSSMSNAASLAIIFEDNEHNFREKDDLFPIQIAKLVANLKAKLSNKTIQSKSGQLLTEITLEFQKG